MADEIIKELWKIKDDIAEEYGCDLKAFVSILRAKKQEDDQPVDDHGYKKGTTKQEDQAHFQR
jgi:hypothetical protein